MYRHEAGIGPRKFLTVALIAIGLRPAAIEWVARIVLLEANELGSLFADVARLEELCASTNGKAVVKTWRRAMS